MTVSTRGAMAARGGYGYNQPGQRAQVRVRSSVSYSRYYA